ncbi:hypothetical protein ACFQVB_42575 [Paraburkholderia humisilvae]|uniref:hypothetical protein n=1 Tax=Paraburkholderia humisilvae TaxID=627669 RepID=UPI0036122D74
MCESFFGTPEAQLLTREHFATHEQARQRIFWFLESWYVQRAPSAWQHWILFTARIRKSERRRQTVPPRGLPPAGQRHGRDRRPAARRWTTRDSTLSGGATPH